MPKLSGLFDSFDNLDQIAVENIVRWLKPPPEPGNIENYLAQRILYPQTVPITETEMKVDLAILREALRLLSPKSGKGGAMLGDNPFVNVTLRKILIPSKFLYFIQNLSILTWVFVDGLLFGRKREDHFEDLWTIVLTGELDEIIGSLVIPEFKKGGELKLSLMGKAYGLNKSYKIRAGTLMVIPCPKERCQVAFELKGGEILDKKNFAIEIYGGRLGLMIDGRGI